jgi:hypothetical protein
MFLPVLLVRDYGLWGWVLFAVPNMFGAAAMAYVLGTRRASLEIVEAHRPACIAFSLTTIAFHCYFLGWIGSLYSFPWISIGFGLASLVFFAALRRRANALVAAAAVTALSLGVLIFLLRAVPPGQMAALLEQFTEPARGGVALAMLAPAFILGFGLSPYMDLTFHHARQANSAGGARVAFTLGFGLIFPAMILLTLLYTPLLLGMFAPLLHVVVVHIVVQSGFTSVLHLEHVFSLVGRVGWKVSVPAALGVLALLLAAPAISIVAPVWAGLDVREVIYWLFMAPYGLIFPAYVWIVMMPERLRRGQRSHRRRSLGVFALAVLAAFPMYWMGFVAGETIWLLPGVGLVLAAGAFCYRWR